jgi:hypothetical protein
MMPPRRAEPPEAIPLFSIDIRIIDGGCSTAQPANRCADFVLRDAPQGLHQKSYSDPQFSTEWVG